MDFHDHTRYKEVREACHSAIIEIGEKKHFRAEAQSRHINWKAKRSSALTSIPAEVDNLIRNIAYKKRLSFNKAMKYFFNQHLSLNKLDRKYSQRPTAADWQSWRRAVHKNKLSSEEKKIDKSVRKMFDEGYGRNRPTVMGF